MCLFSTYPLLSIIYWGLIFSHLRHIQKPTRNNFFAFCVFGLEHHDLLKIERLIGSSLKRTCFEPDGLRLVCDIRFCAGQNFGCMLCTHSPAVTHSCSDTLASADCCPLIALGVMPTTGLDCDLFCLWHSFVPSSVRLHYPLWVLQTWRGYVVKC